MNREESIDYAKKYLEDLLSFFGLNIDVSAGADEEVIELKVPSSRLNAFLIGQRGETLRSLQFMIATTLKNKNAELSRVNLDIAEYKAHRYERLEEQAKDWINSVIESGKSMDLPAMNAAERRVIHRLISDYSELTTHSEGEGRDRHIVLEKKSD